LLRSDRDFMASLRPSRLEEHDRREGYLARRHGVWNLRAPNADCQAVDDPDDAHDPILLLERPLAKDGHPKVGTAGILHLRFTPRFPGHLRPGSTNTPCGSRPCRPVGRQPPPT